MDLFGCGDLHLGVKIGLYAYLAKKISDYIFGEDKDVSVALESLALADRQLFISEFEVHDKTIVIRRLKQLFFSTLMRQVFHFPRFLTSLVYPQGINRSCHHLDVLCDITPQGSSTEETRVLISLHMQRYPSTLDDGNKNPRLANVLVLENNTSQHYHKQIESMINNMDF